MLRTIHAPRLLVLVAFVVASCGAACSGKGCGQPKCPEGAILIPPGTFTVGSDEPFSISDHSPAHKVTLTRPYCIDRTEVTQGALWRCHQQRKECAFVSKTVKNMPPELPADFVNWQQASDFCKAQGGRLPTDAEWEYAARGTDGRIYPWGNEPPTPEHWHWKMDGDLAVTIAKVGTHPKGRSAFGLEDMSGNVKEWVADACHTFTAQQVTDPRGPAGATNGCRVKRGSGWSSFSEDSARAAMRYLDRHPQDRDYETGFRCAYDTH